MSDEIWDSEKKKIREMQRIASGLDSPDLKAMYSAAGKLIAYQPAKSLLPKAMSLLGTDDATLRRLVYRMAARNAYGKYVPELFTAMKSLNPAEREQVLQGVEEAFHEIGAPKSKAETERWVNALEELGREHQPTVFGLMATLGRLGRRWVTKRIKDNIETVSLGAVQKISSFPIKTKKKLIKLISQKAAEKKPDLLPYICGIVDKKTVKYLSPFLRSKTWQDRAKVAETLSQVGIHTTRGMVMDIVADPDWRVKQALVEEINIEESRITSLMKILGHLVTDSHTRVRNAAERSLLQLGSRVCIESDVEKQRKKIERKFRKHLLRAAPRNKDIDSEWLGVDIDDVDVVPVFPDEEDGEDDTSDDQPEGVSLSDIKPKEDASADSKKDLLAALLAEKSKVSNEDDSKKKADSELKIDDSLTPTSKFLKLLRHMSRKKKSGIPLDEFRERALEIGIGVDKFDSILDKLEQEGTIYMSSKDIIKYVDLDL